MKSRLIIPLFTVLLLLPGCASLFFLKKVDFDKPIKLANNETLVFGKIYLAENGKRLLSLSAFLNKPRVNVNVSKRYEGEESLPSIDDNGSFFFIAEEGEYKFIEITPRKLYLANDYKIFPKIYFQILPEDKIIYIGTLKIEYIYDSGYMRGKTSIEVLDEYDEAKEIIEQRIPNLKNQIEKKLATYDPSMKPYWPEEGGRVAGDPGLFAPMFTQGCSLTANSGENSDFRGIFWFSIILILLFTMKEIMKVIR